MNAIEHEHRRRNAYAGSCCHCGAEVKPGEGWLYADTTRHRRFGGKFPKKVKCDRCHRAGVTSKWKAAQLDNPSPAITIRRWSVSEVRKWELEVEQQRATWCGEWLGSEYEVVEGTLVFVSVTINGERVELAGGDPVLNRQTGPWYGYEEGGIGGRPFTPAAWKHLVERVHDLVRNMRSVSLSNSED